MNLDSIIKNIDPIISDILNRVIDGNHILADEALELFNANGIEFNMVVIVANALCKRKKRNRNICHKSKYKFYKCLYQKMWFLCV